MRKKENLIAKPGRLHGRNQLKNNLNQLSVLIVPGGNELIIIAIIGSYSGKLAVLIQHYDIILSFHNLWKFLSRIPSVCKPLSI